MFKKKVVSLLCAAALTVTSFSGVAFAEEPGNAPLINLIPVNDTVQPYEDAEYYLSLNIPEGVTLAGAQIMLDDSNADYTFSDFVPGIDMDEIVWQDNGNNVVFLLSGSDLAMDSYGGEVELGVVKFDKVDSTTEGSYTPSIVYYETDNPTVGTTPGATEVKLEKGTVLPVESAFSAEISIDANDVAEMAYDYNVNLKLDNAAELAENEHGIASLQFDINYDDSKFIFNKATELAAGVEAYEVSEGVVRVAAIVTDDNPIEDYGMFIASLRFKALVDSAVSTSSFTFANEEAGWANMENLTFGEMAVASEDKDVELKRDAIDALLVETEGVAIHADYSKVDVTSGQQDFNADAVFDAEAVAAGDFDLSVVDVNGGNLIGTTSRFVMTGSVIRNEGAPDNYGVASEKIVFDIYNMMMRIKGDVSLNGNAMSIVNISDLSALKGFILSYDHSWETYGEDIQWAATNIAYPDRNSDKVFVYDLVAAKSIILNSAE